MTLQRLVLGMLAQGHRLQVVRPKQNASDLGSHSADFEDITVSGLPLPRYEGLRMGLPAGRLLKKKWRKERPDFVHIATEGPLGWSALFAARQLGLPVTSSFHTNFHTYGQHYGLGLFENMAFAYLRAFHNRTLTTFAPTKAVCEVLAKRGVKNPQVMSRGVDTMLYAPEKRSCALRESWGVSEGQLLVSYVGRLASEKNLDLVIRAFEAMQEENPDARFMLVGDGPLRSSLEAQYPHFIYTGFKRGEALAECYASADVFLFGSMTETFGNVLTEAAASGLACVAYDYAAAREYMHHGADALLAPFGDEDAFIALARRLALDTELRLGLAEKGRKLAESLNWNCVVQSFLDDVKRTIYLEKYAPRPGELAVEGEAGLTANENLFYHES